MDEGKKQGISVLLIGGPGDDCPLNLDGSFRDAAAFVRVDDPLLAAEMLTACDAPPDLIVLAESRPGEFGAVEIDRLRRLAPLARFWRVLGSWCEGESRSGRPPAGCATSYWHQWPARIARELAADKNGDSAAWALPATASNEERLLATASHPIEQRSGLIVVCAPHAETAAALSASCRLAGYTTLTVAERQRWSAPGASAVVWDTDAEHMTDRQSVERLRKCAGGAPLIALVSFPRPDDVRFAAKIGVAAVVSKPFLVRDLLWQIAKIQQNVATATIAHSP